MIKVSSNIFQKQIISCLRKIGYPCSANRVFERHHICANFTHNCLSQADQQEEKGKYCNDLSRETWSRFTRSKEEFFCATHWTRHLK